MEITTYNPYNNEVLGKYKVMELDEIKKIISNLNNNQKKWRENIDYRIDKIKESRGNFEKNMNDLAKLMSSEMGKPISQSIAEVKKTLWLFDYYIENAKNFLANEYVKTEAKKSYIRFDPLGTILIIMPWNFPLWQVARAAIPALLAGNSVLLKHASIVSGTSLKIEELFNLDVFRSVITTGEIIDQAIQYSDGVSFTGSTAAGSKIASEAAKHIKKFVMELGGSDPYIVIDSSNLENAIKNSVFARLQNNGQSCIASKRFIIKDDIYNEFYEGMLNEFEKVRTGDQLDENTYVGPLSSEAQKNIILKQVNELKSYGEVIETGKNEGNLIKPMIVKLNKDYGEEVFGPVAMIKSFKTIDEAIKLANDTPYGLGSSIWGDENEAEKMVPYMDAGTVSINKIVASDPRLPFGGTKKSGIGRELSRYGILEFTNIKTVWIN
ncbi:MULTISPECIES: aldehyde dehydrogenase family protein [Acidiplasma]|uniref:Aldehyde dehydrogenase n=2 Tax=Acidiplasma TaxID=507753 RepID=A0A0Q0VNW2_9ARCH|nr:MULTISPECIES: aldehyde dehydrogenase family protein [Acidiplasma]KJE49572.1 aldehyde dehydrogenase [Acidiplasma sp. MBA-1]KQB34375.1 aldehyde dehydrogenase [Acidiplasma aeolicum]KQB35250.1 aldehyde dehydrogenase [Acidiplasma cupricumulans]WMT55882.1 MAG: aldehyde dehydrogenase family protein [Acidiplasma sp.]